jgi:Fe-Mn family superoxide dismutase
MQIHHTKHHNAYVTNLNKAIETLDEKLAERAGELETIFEKMSKFPDAVRNNAGGHYNHSMFWNCMKPNGGGTPKGALADAINASFGSFEEFKTKFNEAATKRFGSGWAWLIVVEDKLVITSTANQDNPLMKLKDKNHVMGRPILALDVWEHAYYLKNQNRRGDYLTAFWNVVNWEYCEGVFG